MDYECQTLKKLGVPDDCVPVFVVAIKDFSIAFKDNAVGLDVVSTAEGFVKVILKHPESYVNDPEFGEAAKSIISHRSP